MKFVLLILLFSIASASRILFLFPTPSKSHMVIVHAVSTALAEKGHEVTVVSPFPVEKKKKNHREIKSPVTKEIQNFLNVVIKEGEVSIFKVVLKFIEISIKIAVDMAEMKEFQDLLTEHFDLVVTGIPSNLLLGYGDHFKCPTALLSVQQHFFLTDLLIGNPMESHAVPNFNLSVQKMNFLSKVKNFLMNGIFLALNAYENYEQEKVYNKLFPKEKYRSFDESIKNISITLINDHFSDGHPRPLVPGSIEIRGVQVKQKREELPADLKKFMDDATEEGVIFFSLGTYVHSSIISKDILILILKVFENLKQKVIMKWNPKDISNKPSNVFIQDWLPQDDILAHPNLKLFISHCGLGGMVESKFHGVPILGLPMFADQMQNAVDGVQEGWTLILDIKTVTEKELQDTINEMMQNDSYSSTAKHFSKLLNDRPLSPIDTAIYWLEYVIRHHGAPHLQYPAVHQNFIQRCSLDVIAFLLAVIYVSFKISKFILKLSFKRVCRIFSKNSSSKIKKN